VSYNYKVTLPSGATYGPTNVGNVTSVSGAFGGVGTSTFSVQTVYAGGAVSNWATACAITYDPTAPTVPTLLTPVNTGFTNVNDFYFDWTDSVDTSAVTYEFQSSQNPATAGGVLTSGVWNNIAHGNAEQNLLTTSTIHSVGANGTWYWQVRAIDAAGNKSGWTPVWKLTIDMVKPVATISSPLNGSYVSTRANGWKLDVKGSVADANSNYAYVQLLTEQHGAIEGKTIYGAFATNSLLTSFDTAGMADGAYGLNIAAADGAGNVFNLAQTSGYVDFYLDNTKPTISVNTANGALNPTTLSVTAGDNMRLKLVTANIYNEANLTLIKSCSKNVSANNVTSFTLDTCSTAGLADGVYTLRTNASDMAGNISTTLSSTKFTIDTSVPEPSVTPEDFGVGSWTIANDGFTGVNVGFALAHFKTVSGITVDLYDSTGKFVSNTANPTFVALINSEGWKQLSSPFVVSGTLTDTWCAGGPCWAAGTYVWTAANKPVKAVITVEGTTLDDQIVTKTAENTNFLEATADFADILPAAPTTGGNNGQSGSVAGETVTNRPTLPPVASPQAQRAVALNNPNVADDVAEDETTEVLGETTAAPTTLAATTVDNEVSEAAPTTSNRALWWTIGILAVLAGGWWAIAATRRRNE
jgi:hypothetical protein